MRTFKSAIRIWSHSLKTRLTLTMLAIFLLALGALSIYASRALETDMERLLGEQQLSAVAFVAASVNGELEDRIQVLKQTSDSFDAGLQQNPSAAQRFLDQRILLRSHFNVGVFVAGADGKVSASVSSSDGWNGANHAENDAVRTALSEGKPAIGRPVMVPGMDQPLFTIAVPILDARGKVSGAMVGVSNLKQANQLERIAQYSYGETGGYLLVAPQHGIFVSATDSSRILQPLPPPGVNRMHDRYMQGYEGYGIAVNSRGVEELSASKKVPVAGWFVVAVLPTQEAFAPIERLRRNIEIAAAALILCAGMLIWWLLRRQLSPLQETVGSLVAMSEGKQALQPLPVTNLDEIGYLIGGFNRLMKQLERRESQLMESEARFRQQFEEHSAVMLLVDPGTGQIVDANPAAAQFYGYTLEQLRGMSIDRINTLSGEEVAQRRMEALQQQRNYFVFPHRLANNEIRTVEVHSSPVHMGGRQLLYSIVHDITRRSEAERLLQQQLFFARTLNRIAEVIVTGASAQKILDEVAQIIGEALAADRALIYDISFASRQIIGLSEYLNPHHPDIAATKATYPLEIFEAGAAEVRRTRRPLVSQDDDVNPHLAADGSARILHGQMSIRSLLWHPFAFREDGFHLLVLNEIKSRHEWDSQELEFLDAVNRQLSIALGKIEMMEARKIDEDRIQYLARFDALTALPNKAQVDERINYLLSLAKRGHSQLAVMFLDLDHFKNINDTLGHSTGDALLMEVANRLKSNVREEDMIARMGGDEFILLLPNCEVQAASHVAEKLLDVIAQPFRFEGRELSVTPSIGIALCPADGQDYQTLGSNADTAMYRAKQDGRNCYRFFTNDMQTRSVRMLQLSNALRQALQHDEMRLHFQPQLDMRTGRLVGVEALLRWQHPELGYVSPAEFIPLAEESGLILPIGEWVMRTAAQQARRWLDAGFAPLVMAVNLSAVQFRHASLPDMVTNILNEAQLPPEYLELELTEGVAMRDPQSAIATMHNLHELGVRMSIDDFGTGYSSLSYLKKFKVYKLKIDQSFVRDISTDQEDRAIVGAVINMAASLGLQTIAEGVETEKQLAFLREQGCNEVQGYYFSKPLAAENFEVWMSSHGHLHERKGTAAMHCSNGESWHEQ